MNLESKVAGLVEGFYVVKVAKCSTCNGTGFVTHPFWVSYWELPDRPRKEPEEYLEDFGYDSLPPEEVFCDECNGIGTSFVFYPLKDAIRELEAVKGK